MAQQVEVLHWRINGNNHNVAFCYFAFANSEGRNPLIFHNNARQTKQTNTEKNMNTRDFYSLVKRQRALTFEYNKTKNQDVLKEWQNNGRIIDAELKRIDEALRKKGEQAL